MVRGRGLVEQLGYRGRVHFSNSVQGKPSTLGPRRLPAEGNYIAGRGGLLYAKPQGYEARAPGDLVQVDTLSVSLGPGEEVKHFCAVERSTRLAWAEVHRRATAQTAAVFLRARVDGGSEFMAAFEEGCQRLGIRLFGVPSSMAMWKG